MNDVILTLNITELHNKFGLSADMYLLLWFKHQNIPLPDLYQDYSKNLDLLNYLEKEELIKITDSNTGEFELRAKGEKLFSIDDADKAWYEFVSTFPFKVPSRNGGTRPLRASDPDAISNKKAKEKYKRMIKNNPGLHSFILQVLKAEIEHRRNTISLQFMHNIDTWLNQRDWEKYSYLLEKENDSDEIINAKDDPGYGTECV